MTTQELSRLVLEKDKSGLPLDRKVKLCVVRMPYMYLVRFPGQVSWGT